MYTICFLPVSYTHLYYGADTEETEAEELATALEEAYPDCDVELNAGGQPIYYYVISVE